MDNLKHMAIKVSFIVVNFNKKDCLQNLIDSIKRHCGNFNYEIIVVDNASSDGSAQMVRNSFSDVKLIILDRNAGCCPAYNAGFNQTKGQYICLMHEDIIVHENTIQRLIEFLDANPRAGYAGPANYDNKGNLQRTVDKFHTPCYDIFFSYMYIISIIHDNIFHRRKKRLPDKPMKVDYMSISCLMLKRVAIEGLGFFENDIAQWWDDPQIQLKMHRASWHGYFLPHAKITHYRGLTEKGHHESDKVAPIELLWIYSKYKYFKKFYGAGGLFMVRCNDSAVFTIYLLTNLFRYYAISKDTNTKWEINKWLAFLKVALNIKCLDALTP
ncbi:MAG: glycosyltransferase [Candidatus Omnitrophota bacterium]